MMLLIEYISAQLGFITHRDYEQKYLKWYLLNNPNTSCSYVLPHQKSDLNNFYFLELSSKEIFISNRNNLHYLNNSGIQIESTGKIFIQFTSRLTLQNDYYAASANKISDPNFEGREHLSTGEWVAYIPFSFLKYDYGKGFIGGGRANVFFNPYSSSLLLNPSITSNPTVWWHHVGTNFGSDHFITVLNPVNELDRLVSVHRYYYQLSQWQFGVSELALMAYSKIGKREINYLLPSISFFEVSTNDRFSENENIFLMFDATHRGVRSIFNVEIIIDDLALDKGSPNKIGYQTSFGYSWSKSLALWLNYAKIMRWVGNYFLPELRMAENGHNIGHPIGPDAHQLLFSIKYELNESFTLYTNIMLLERGTSSINDWPVGIQEGENFGYRDELFPTRPIISNQQLSMHIDWHFFKNRIIFSPEIYLQSTNNPLFGFQFILL